MKRLFKFILSLNAIFLFSVFLMWATWHAIKGGPRIKASVAEKIIELAKLPSSAYNYFFHGGPLTNRLVFDDSVSLIKVSRPSDSPDASCKILISTFEDNSTQKVSLVDINTNKVEKKWQISNQELDACVSRNYSLNEIVMAGMHNPYMQKDSSIIFNNVGLFRVTKKGKLELLNSDFKYHHTIEAESDSVFWICGSQKGGKNEISQVRDTSLVEDVIVGFNLSQKKVFHSMPISKALLENGYDYLFRAPGLFPQDRFHINDIQPIKISSKYWQVGDLLISLKHLSAIFIYRPSTQRIIWLKQGPWLSQHDIDVVDHKTIAIFNNNVLRSSNGDVSVKGYNSILFYNFENGTTSAPYDSIFQKFKINTISEGRYDILPNGDLYIDNANYGKLIIVENGKIKWLYTERFDKNHIKRFYWPRILFN